MFETLDDEVAELSTFLKVDSDDGNESYQVENIDVAVESDVDINADCCAVGDSSDSVVFNNDNGCEVQSCIQLFYF